MSPDQFTIYNMRQRLDEVGDLWADMFDKRVDMKKVIDRIG